VDEAVEEEVEEAVEEEEEEEKEEETETKEVEEDTSNRRRSGRSRKKVETLNFGHTEAKTFELPEGPGAKFGEIVLINGRIDKIKGDDPLTKKLYRICFGRNSKKSTAKRHLRQFSGFSADTADATVEKRTIWVGKNCDVANFLKPLLGFLDLPIAGTKADLVDGLVAFLRSPTDSGKEYTSFSFSKGKKRKRSTKKKTKSTTPRKPSGYMMFLKANRPGVKVEHPELSMIETTQHLAKEWGKQTVEKKAEWKVKADEAPTPPPKKKKAKTSTKKKTKTKTKKKPKKKKPKKQESSDEESEEEESSDDDSPLGGAGIESKLDAAVKKIVMEGDLNTLTKKLVRKLLAPDFGDAVAENKDLIKACIKKYTTIRANE